MPDNSQFIQSAASRGLTTQIEINSRLYWFENGVLTKNTVTFPPQANGLTLTETGADYLTFTTDCRNRGNAVSVNLEISSDGGVTWGLAFTADATQGDDIQLNANGLQAATEYNFRVFYENEAGRGANSEAQAFSTLQAPPQNFAGYSSATSIFLSWDNPLVKFVEIQRKLSGSGDAFSVVATVSDTTYTETPPDQTAWLYRVRFNDGGYISTFSNEIELTTTL